MRQQFMGCTVHVHHKGGNSQQEMTRANQLSDQQNQLMQKQLAMQQNQFNMVNPQLQSIISNGGMDPKIEAAMRSQAMNSLPQQYNNLYGQLNNQLVQRGVTGGGMAGGGDIARQFGALGSAEAGQQAGMLSNIQLQKQQGLYQAMGEALGIGGMQGQNVGTFNSGSVNALGQGVNAANNADQASTGFWGSMFGALGSLGSAGIGKIPCWVAAELYGGWFAPETVSIRNWLFGTWYMLPFAALYSAVGERWAALIRRNSWARRATKRLFDLFLRKANG